MRSPLLDLGATFHAVRPALERDLPLLVPVGAALLLFPQLILTRFASDLPAFGASEVPPIGVSLLLAATALLGLLFQLFLSMDVLGTRPGATVAGLLTASARLLPAGLAASLCQALAIVPGALLLSSGRPQLALPGLLATLVGAFILVRLSLAVPVLVAEGGGPVRAVARSWNLTAGHALRLAGMFLVLMLGFLLLLLLAAGFGSAIASVVTLALGEPASGWGAGRWIAELFEAGASSLFSASLAIFVALLYRLLAARG